MKVMMFWQHCENIWDNFPKVHENMKTNMMLAELMSNYKLVAGTRFTFILVSLQPPIKTLTPIIFHVTQ